MEKKRSLTEPLLSKIYTWESNIGPKTAKDVRMDILKHFEMSFLLRYLRSLNPISTPKNSLVKWLTYLTTL